MEFAILTESQRATDAPRMLRKYPLVVIEEDLSTQILFANEGYRSMMPIDWGDVEKADYMEYPGIRLYRLTSQIVDLICESVTVFRLYDIHDFRDQGTS